MISLSVHMLTSQLLVCLVILCSLPSPVVSAAFHFLLFHILVFSQSHLIFFWCIFFIEQFCWQISLYLFFLDYLLCSFPAKKLLSPNFNYQYSVVLDFVADTNHGSLWTFMICISTSPWWTLLLTFPVHRHRQNPMSDANDLFWTYHGLCHNHLAMPRWLKFETFQWDPHFMVCHRLCPQLSWFVVCDFPRQSFGESQCTGIWAF